MSDWKEELIEHLSNKAFLSPTQQGILTDMLLPLLEAGEALRTSGIQWANTAPANYDAAKQAALEGTSGRSTERYLEDLERGGNPA